jgi:hypothetical protein
MGGTSGETPVELRFRAQEGRKIKPLLLYRNTPSRCIHKATHVCFWNAFAARVVGSTECSLEDFLMRGKLGKIRKTLKRISAQPRMFRSSSRFQKVPEEVPSKCVHNRRGAASLPPTLR